MSIIITNKSITLYENGMTKTINSTGATSINLKPNGIFYSNASISEDSSSFSIQPKNIYHSLNLGDQSVLEDNGTLNTHMSISGHTITGIIPEGPTGLQAIVTPSAAGSTGTVSLSFTAPLNSGTPITSYNVVPNPTAPITSTANVPTPPITVSNLTNGQTYTFTLSANNASGTGIAVTSNSVTPYAYPNDPLGITGYFSDDQHADKQCMLTFTKPVINGLDNGPNKITSYNIYKNGDLVGSLPNNVYGTGISGLTNGTSYSFGVAAVNAAGTGNRSVASPIIPFTIPNAPVINGVSGITTTNAIISFSAPSNTNDYIGAPITSYNLMAGATGYSSISGNSNTVSPITLSTLHPNTTYSLELTATNKAGTSPIATTSVTTYPMAPTGVNALHTGVSGEINVFWTNHNLNGPVPLSYNIVYNSNTILGITGSSYKVTGLTNGTSYSFSVYAVNQTGQSVSSSVVSQKPSTTPYAPTDVQAVLVSSTSIKVTFVAPSDNGGSDITGYNIYKNSYDPANLIPSSSVVIGSTGSNYTAIVSNLSTNTSYSFIVEAVNENGDNDREQKSNKSLSVVTATVPSAPTILSVTTTKTSAEIKINVPTSNGAPILDYTVKVYDSNDLDVKSKTENATTITVSELTPNTEYKFRVLARNEIGNSQLSSLSSRYYTLPNAPTGVTSAYVNGIPKISWTDPNEQVKLKYKLSYLTNTITDINTTYYNLSGLTPGTQYTVSVVAYNDGGDSSPTTITFTAASAPDKPVLTLTQSTPGEVTLEIKTAPGDNGSSITSYDYYCYLNEIEVNKINKTDLTAATFISLTIGSSYRFSVKATNGVGATSSDVSTTMIYDTPSVVQSSSIINDLTDTSIGDETSQFPINLNKDNLTQSTVTLSYNGSTSSNLTYKIYTYRYATTPTLDNTIPVVTSTASGPRAVTISGLMGNCAYVFGVQTCNPYFSSDISLMTGYVRTRAYAPTVRMNYASNYNFELPVIVQFKNSPNNDYTTPCEYDFMFYKSGEANVVRLINVNSDHVYLKQSELTVGDHLYSDFSDYPNNYLIINNKINNGFIKVDNYTSFDIYDWMRTNPSRIFSVQTYPHNTGYDNTIQNSPSTTSQFSLIY